MRYLDHTRRDKGKLSLELTQREKQSPQRAAADPASLGRPATRRSCDRVSCATADQQRVASAMADRETLKLRVRRAVFWRSYGHCEYGPCSKRAATWNDGNIGAVGEFSHILPVGDKGPRSQFKKDFPDIDLDGEDKRLRLPDLLCVRTGTRVEVRAKSDLKIRMSDAPTNVERRWNSGMRGEDLTAFITCFDDDGTPRAAAEAAFFTFGDLQETEAKSQLGPVKSASEGAERDRTWSSIVPQRNGIVEFVDKTVIRVMMDADSERPGRPQTFQLRDRVPYVTTGDRFIAEASIIAGVPARRMGLKAYSQNKYRPLDDLDATDAVDRYAAVKSLPFTSVLKSKAAAAIERRLDVETEDRVLLEAAGAGTACESGEAWSRLERFVWNQDRADLRMEAVFILTELRSAGARDVLIKIANDPTFANDEIRQAAVWGLGKAGVQRYADLVSFLNDPERDVALHAIAAFGRDTPEAVIEQLIKRTDFWRQAALACRFGSLAYYRKRSRAQDSYCGGAGKNRLGRLGAGNPWQVARPEGARRSRR